MLASSATAIARTSSANASGCPWKLPLETSSSSSTSTSGLSVAAFSSTLTVYSAYSRRSRTAPCTCGAQRSEYASCTLSHQRCASMIAEPSSRRSTFAAAARWPRSGRRAWICGRNDVRDPCRASTESAQATSATRPSRRARTSASASIAAMNCVPLTSESPSFASSCTGSRPARVSASTPASRSPSTHASPSPTSGSARCASGARSPEAPTEPRLGTTGSTPRSSSARSSSTVSTRAPELPFASAFARRSIAARTISPGYGSPTPHAWERSSRSCSSAVCSSGIATATKRPKPVLTP